MVYINQGLENVVVSSTKISNVDGKHGELVYAGFLLEELIERGCTYEDVLFLLLKKRLPTSEESHKFSAYLASKRALSPELEAMIDAIPRNLEPIEALRTGISALSSQINSSYPPNEEQALELIAKAPLILSRYYRLQTKQAILESDSKLSHVENYLYLLTGKNEKNTKHYKAYARALEIYFISTIEHGMNASTFGARVSTSTQSDLISSVTAALSVLKGPLHGGAPLEVVHMLDAIGKEDHAEAWIRQEISAGRRIMGFGHRVYETYDPRAKILLDAIEQLPVDDQNVNLSLSRYVEKTAIKILQELKPGKKLYTNVEFGAASILRAVGLPETLYPATFGLSRSGGWVAHILEQSEKNRLIRPTSQYDGPWPQKVLDRQAKALPEKPKEKKHSPAIFQPFRPKATPIESRKPSSFEINISFLMHTLVYPTAKICAAIIAVAGFALLASSVSPLSYWVTVGALGFGLASNGLFSNNTSPSNDSLTPQCVTR